MSKESYKGDKCACGQRIAYPEFHWPHCHMNPVNLSKHAPEFYSRVEAKFTKAELQEIATHGPVRDERLVSTRRGKDKKTSAKKGRGANG